MALVQTYDDLDRRFPGDVDRIYSIIDASSITGLSPWTLRRRAKAGKLKILKLSPRRVGIRASELRRFLDEAEAA